MTEKPFSPSCQRNQEPILEVFKKLIRKEDKALLELGSGTGQHAAFIAPKFPWLSWTCSDLKSQHEAIKMWTEDIQNVKGPIEYEVAKSNFPEGDFDVVFTANTFHIMSWDLCQRFIKDCGENLNKGTMIIIYGPFNYDGKYTSESNAQFDLWLKERNQLSAIRDFEKVCESFAEAGFQLERDIEMPANNRILVFCN